MKNDVWLFSDLDGTLLPSDKRIPDDLRDGIQQFVQQGGHFTIATGRTIESARTYWEQLSVKESMILFNGAMIYDPVSEQILYQQPLCASAREMAAAVLKEFPQAGSEILCADGTYVIQNTIYEQQHVAICQVTPKYCTLETMPDIPWMKILFAVDPSDMPRLQAFIQAQNWTDVDFIQSSDSFYEMLPKQVSKGSALVEYRKRFHLESPSIVVAAGDYENDRAMLEAADYGVAPANAQPAIQAIADHVLTHTCDQKAILELLLWIILHPLGTLHPGTQIQAHGGVIEGTYCAKSGHPGGSLSISDLLTYLYFAKMHIDPKQPEMADRDRLVLSKGHCAPALYATLAQRGFFPQEELQSLRHIGAMLQGHPCIHTPGIDMSSGSLGQGISVACGMALAGKLDNAAYKVYTILGDGEIEEGQVWEAAMFASHYHLDNLLAIVDYNGLQIDGQLSEVCSPEPIPEKFAAFGWHVIQMDAHDFDSIEAAFAEAEQIVGQPVVIVQKSVKGKGVSFMENQVGWHGKAPNQAEYEQAMAELTAQLQELEG